MEFKYLVNQIVNEYSQHKRILLKYGYRIGCLKCAYKKVNYFKNYELMLKLSNKIDQVKQELNQYIEDFKANHPNYPAVYGRMEEDTFKMLILNKMITIEVMGNGKIKFNC